MRASSKMLLGPAALATVVATADTALSPLPHALLQEVHLAQEIGLIVLDYLRSFCSATKVWMKFV